MARPQRRRRPGGVFARVPRAELLSWRGLENSIGPRMLDKIRQSVRTRHKLKLRWGILLRNVEDNRPLFWYTNNPGSPWFSKLSETKDWLEALEESRLQGNVQKTQHEMGFQQGRFC